MQSAPKSRLGTFTVIEATPDRLDESPGVLRRHWSDEAKARILEEAIVPGAIAILPARSEDQAQSFAPVEVAPGNGNRTGCLEIVIGDATIRVDRYVAPTLLVETIRALRSA